MQRKIEMKAHQTGCGTFIDTGFHVPSLHKSFPARCTLSLCPHQSYAGGTEILPAVTGEELWAESPTGHVGFGLSLSCGAQTNQPAPEVFPKCS